MLKRFGIRSLAMLLVLVVFAAVMSGCQNLGGMSEPELEELSYEDGEYFDPDKVYAVGDRFLFGEYEQDNDKENGKEYIKWRVLEVENRRALVVSEYGLEYKKYNEYDNVLLEWENSALRKWLNSDFLSEAFSDEEQEKIMDTPNVNEGVVYYDTTTNDKLFCLSANEVGRLFDSEEDRICKPTRYALENSNKSTLNGSRNHWWMRNAGTYQSFGAYVQADGIMNLKGISADIDAVFVRPAFYVNCAAQEVELGTYRETEALYFDSETKYKVGDHFLFGSYEQDGNTTNGREYIEWRVVDKEEDKLLVLSEYGLDCVWYEPDDGRTRLDWSTCYLRAWLNNVFQYNAFTDEERSLIILSSISNTGNEHTEVAGGASTNDKLFCLSIEEVQKYYPIDENEALNAFYSNENVYDNLMEQMSSRICEPTEYAKMRCTETDNLYSKEGKSWWLRSPGGTFGYAAEVKDDGNIHYIGANVGNDTMAVRPAFYIEIG